MSEMGSQTQGSPPISPRTAIVLLLPLIVIYAAWFAHSMANSTYDVWGAIALAPVLIAISIPALLRFARREDDPYIGLVLIGALIFKIVAAVPRHYMVAVLYQTGDSVGYAERGILLRQAFLSGDFSLAALDSTSRTGTEFVEIVTGVVYTIIGPSFIGGFIFFSWLGFWGLFFFYRAFCKAIPDADKRRYAALLFFLPSLVFWPSSIGKEAWMMLMLGMATYGCALLLTRNRGATIYLSIGMAGILVVRPHVALLVIAGLVIGYALRGFGEQRAVALGKARTLLGLVAIGGVTLFAIRQVTKYFGLENFDVDTVTETLEYAEGQTGQGGSEFVGSGPSLRNLPLNLVTVLFRPFPHEVHNLQALFTAAEGALLMLLFALALPRLRTIWKQVFKRPYVAFCVTYILVFCYAFSSFQNFGILARERVMVFPFVLALLALPMAGVHRRRTGDRAKSPGDATTEPSAIMYEPQDEQLTRL